PRPAAVRTSPASTSRASRSPLVASAASSSRTRSSTTHSPAAATSIYTPAPPTPDPPPRLWRVDPSAARSRISELADTLGLAELLDRPVASYSGGERRRLEISRALVAEPEGLFLHKPTVG